MRIRYPNVYKTFFSTVLNYADPIATRFDSRTGTSGGLRGGTGTDPPREGDGDRPDPRAPGTLHGRQGAAGRAARKTRAGADGARVAQEGGDAGRAEGAERGIAEEGTDQAAGGKRTHSRHRNTTGPRRFRAYAQVNANLDSPITW